MKYCFIIAIFLICMAITVVDVATIKRNFEVDQLLVPRGARWRRELKNKISDKDSSEESSESNEKSDEKEDGKIEEGSGMNVPKLELLPGRKIHIGSNEGSGMDLIESETEGSGSEDK
uniref:Uncharacterized protein n=1 Tax=Strongyloides papillosus TaxID=174720 RepID=A0A0N5BRL4_STREA